MHDGLRVVGVHVEDGRVDHPGHVGRVGGGARHAGVRGEADLKGTRIVTVRTMRISGRSNKKDHIKKLIHKINPIIPSRAAAIGRFNGESIEIKGIKSDFGIGLIVSVYLVHVTNICCFM